MSLSLISVLACAASATNRLPAIDESNARADMYIDARDGRQYRTLRLGGAVWFGENLAINLSDSWCYEDQASNCSSLGRLHSWSSAQRACPTGWHLPTESEWMRIISAYGGYRDLIQARDVGDPHQSYLALREGGMSRFEAKLAGNRSPKGAFVDIHGDGIYWSGTSCGRDSVVSIVFNDAHQRILRDCDQATWGQSVRCVQ